MIKRNHLSQHDVDDVKPQLMTEFDSEISAWLQNSTGPCKNNDLVEGVVREIRDTHVIIDIGYKSEGFINIDEWREEGSALNIPNVGDKIQVLLENIENEAGVISLSYRKAKRQRDWIEFLGKHKEGDRVMGLVTRKIRAGLIVDVGINSFMSASEVDIRRPADLASYVGRNLECQILKIDHQHRNIVLSRRKLIEEYRRELRVKLLREIKPGQLRMGVVKNIAEFGAFVDLGGLDGLLLVVDMAWTRIKSPHEVVKLDQELEVYVISVDLEREKIALGLKQKSPNPWENIEAKYPIGSRHRGEVVNIVTYGAFVQLVPGIEGLVHIFEMCWIRSRNDPREIVSVGQEVEVQVLGVDPQKKQISLGMKQCQENPWKKMGERYPPNTIVTGTVRTLTNYGAFLELEGGFQGLLNINDLRWGPKVNHPSEVVQIGQQVTCIILMIDPERGRISLGLKQMPDEPTILSDTTGDPTLLSERR